MPMKIDPKIEKRNRGFKRRLRSYILINKLIFSERNLHEKLRHAVRTEIPDVRAHGIPPTYGPFPRLVTCCEYVVDSV